MARIRQEIPLVFFLTLITCVHRLIASPEGGTKHYSCSIQTGFLSLFPLNNKTFYKIAQKYRLTSYERRKRKFYLEWLSCTWPDSFDAESAPSSTLASLTQRHFGD